MHVGWSVAWGVAAAVVLTGCQGKGPSQQAMGGGGQAGYPYVAPVGWSTQVRCDGMDELKHKVDELEKAMNGIALTPEEGKKLESTSSSSKQGVGGGGGAGSKSDEEASSQESLDQKLDALSRQVDALEKRVHQRKRKK